MKKLATPLSILICILAISNSVYSQTVSVTTTATAQVRPLSNFNFIALKMSGNVYVTQEERFSVRIEAPDNVMDKITTDVSNNTLEIGSKIKWTSGVQPTIKVYVSMPKPNGLEVDGSGSIIMQTKLTTDFLALTVNGSGSIKAMETASQKLNLQVNGSGSIHYDNVVAETALVEVEGSGSIKGDDMMCKMISLSISGSGEIKSANVSSEKISMVNDGSGSIHLDGGVASVAMIENAGSGDINAGNLNGSSISAINSGSGDIVIGTGETLQAQLTGSGDIRYHTAPQTIHKDVSGSGRVGPL